MKRRTRGKGEGPNEIDALVGERLRELRMLAGMSQGDLAATIGLTFQQLQKYERGVNRISASKLYLLSRHLNVPVSALFVGLDGARGGDVSVSFSAGMAPETEGVSGGDSHLRSREALVLARHFMRIKDDQARAAIKAFADACAGLGSAGAQSDSDTVPASMTRVRGALLSDSAAPPRRGRRPRGVVWHPTDIGRL